RGKTELVSITVALKSAVASDIVPEIKKLMGPFGEVVAVSKANQLFLQDTAGNLTRILAVLTDIELARAHKDTSYKCVNIKASDAVVKLRDLMGMPTEADPRAAQNKLPPQLHITADERTNTVLITGTVERVTQAKKILKEIDIPLSGSDPNL